MCFHIDFKYPKKKKAKKDITCYKILCKNWESIVQGFKYVQGKVYSDDDTLNIENLGLIWIIHRGYHSYSNKKEVLQDYKSRLDKYRLIIVECIIPKESDYYYNSYYHEYVSNKIKITDIIK